MNDADARQVVSKRSPDVWAADVYVVLDERHGKYSGKRGRLTGGHSLVYGEGSYFEVEFPGSQRPVLIDEDCVYGRCRKSSEHRDRWLLKS